MTSIVSGRRTLIFIVAILFIIAAGLPKEARAQANGAPGMSQQQQPMPSQQPMPGETGPGFPQAQQQPQPSYSDQSFVRKTLEDNVAQEQMGQLAQQKSSSDDVKQFGERMAEIHTKLTEQMQPVAQKLGVDQPKEPSKRDKQEIEKMQSLSGQDFDTAFLQAMLRDQQADLKGFKDEAQSQDPAMQQLAKADTPVLAQHLQILKQLAQEHNVSTDESRK
jgi:putative membrane protein